MEIWRAIPILAAVSACALPPPHSQASRQHDVCVESLGKADRDLHEQAAKQRWDVFHTVATNYLAGPLPRVCAGDERDRAEMAAIASFLAQQCPAHAQGMADDVLRKGSRAFLNLYDRELRELRMQCGDPSAAAGVDAYASAVAALHGRDDESRRAWVAHRDELMRDPRYQRMRERHDEIRRDQVVVTAELEQARKQHDADPFEDERRGSPALSRARELENRARSLDQEDEALQRDVRAIMDEHGVGAYGGDPFAP